MTQTAARDLRRRKRILREERGAAFAEGSIDKLVSKLEAVASGGAQLGTTVAEDPAIRTFGYAKHATILARFEPGTLRVLRVFFKGQDWRHPTR